MRFTDSNATNLMSFAAATPNCVIPSDVLGYQIRESDLLVRTPTVRDGFMEVPTGPGLGVELDEDLVRRYLVG